MHHYAHHPLFQADLTPALSAATTAQVSVVDHPSVLGQAQDSLNDCSPRSDDDNVECGLTRSKRRAATEQGEVVDGSSAPVSGNETEGKDGSSIKLHLSPSQSKKNRRAYTIQQKVDIVQQFWQSGRDYKFMAEKGIHMSNLCDWEHDFHKMKEHLAMGLGEKRYVSRKMKEATKRLAETESMSWVVIEGQKYALDDTKRLWLSPEYYVREKGNAASVWSRPGMNGQHVILKPYKEYEVSKIACDWSDDERQKYGGGGLASHHASGLSVDTIMMVPALPNKVKPLGDVVSGSSASRFFV